MRFGKKSYNITNSNPRIGISISVILAIAFSAGMAANANAADGQHVKNKTVQLYMKKYQKNDVVFYSGRSLAKTTSVSAEEYFKGSPYICTPSGFGKTSHCYNRGAF
ncbi:hypothetical protein [Rhizobium sp. No.120]